MAIKISELNSIKTPLDGNEVIPIVQGEETKKVSVNEIRGNFYYDNGDSDSIRDIDWSRGSLQEINLVDDPTLTFTNGTIAQKTTLLIKQQLPGLRAITWPREVIWNAGNSPTLQTIQDAGPIDNTFSIGTGFKGSVRTITIQPDEKILVGGDFTSYNETSVNRIIRLNSDGSIDRFSIGTGFNGTVYAITIQGDGKILVGGDFTTYNDESSNYLIRLNPDGSIDGEFSIGTGFNGAVYAITIQGDGKILVGGDFTTYESSNYLIRLNPDGSIDGEFSIGTGFNGTVYAITIQSENSSFLTNPQLRIENILVGGEFTSYNETSVNRIIRLNSDGRIDRFSIGTGFNGTVYAIEFQSDGKILVGGDFTTYNGESSNYLIRLNPDGSIDNKFLLGTGFNGTVYKIAPMKGMEGDKILVGGDFTSYNETDINYIVRLNSDGTIDDSFYSGRGFDSSVNSIVIHSNGNILVGGDFTSYDEISMNYIVRLLGLPQLSYNKIDFEYNGIYYIGSY